MRRKLGGGLLPLYAEGAVSPSSRMWPVPRPTFMPNATLIHPAVWPQWTWAENCGRGSLFGEGRTGSMSNTKSPGAGPTSIPSGILIHAAIWQQQIWAENWEGSAALGEELGPHLTQCGQGRGLPACQVGHNTPTSQTGQTENGLIA